MLRYRPAMLGALLFLALALPSHADTYNLQETGVLSPSIAACSHGNSINDNGEVAGESYPSETATLGTAAFSWQNGVITAITAATPPFGDVSGAAAINNNGEIGGTFYSIIDGFSELYLNVGGVSTIYVQPGAGNPFPQINGINTAGEAVGQYGTIDGNAITMINGTYTQLPSLPGDQPDYNAANAINNSNPPEVVGYTTSADGIDQHAVLWKNGVAYNIGTLGGLSALANGINDAGVIVGQSNMPTNPDGTINVHAFKWTPNVANGTTGTMIDLGIVATGANSYARGINNAGVVVGNADVFNIILQPTAFVWTAAAGMLDLHPLVVSENSTAESGLGYYLSANGINSGGQIVGTGVWGEGAIDSSALRGVVLSPTGGVAPAAPGNLQAIDPAGNTHKVVAATGSTNTVDLTWQAGSVSATGFQIQRQTANSGIWLIAGTTTGPLLAFSDVTVQPNTSYLYRVFATNTYGSSGPSNVASVTTGTTSISVVSAAYAPSTVQIGTSAIGTITISAPAPAGGANVSVYFDGVYLGYLPIAATATSGTYSQATDTLLDGTHVLSAQYNGTTATGNLVITSNPTLPTLLSIVYAPNPVAPGGTTYGTIDISGVTPADGIVANLYENGASAGIAGFGANVSSTIYAFTASTVPGAYNESAVFNGTRVTTTLTVTGTTTAPAAPTGLTATPGAGQVVLSWAASSGATSYNVYRGTVAAGESTTPIATGIATTAYTNTGLINGTTYFYKVGAVNTGGTSTQSNEASATPQVTTPAAPTGLTATPGVGQVVLSWTASTGATSDNVYRGTAAAGESATPIATGIATTAYTNTGLINGTTYFYKVGAVNTGGTSTQSNEASATPQVTTPTAPTGLTATAGVGQVVLSWTASSGATSYNVYRGTAAAGESATPVATGIATTAYTNTGLINGTTYFYKVGAVNTGGTSTQSNEASATPQVTTPAAPTGLTATPAVGQVVLSWTASTGATSYNVYRGTAAAGESATPIATGIITTVDTDNGLTNGTTYFYKVSAVNAAGTSAQSNEASATPQVTTPAAPTGLTATPGVAQVGLSWTASSGATSYNVYRGTAAAGESATPVATGITATAYTNTGLTNGTTYFYKVSAVNAGGTSAQSNEASATPAGGTLPVAPTGLTATAGNAQVILTWSTSTGATSYSIFRATTTRGEGRTPLVVGVASTTYTDAAVVNGTAYYYTITAVNSTGSSAQSAEVHATPSGASVPAAPSGLSATAASATVSLSWTAGAGATSYNVYRGTAAGGESATPIATSLTVTIFIDTGLVNGTTYYYKVSAVNASGTSAQSNEAAATPQVSVPPAPSGLTATPGVAQVVLSWTASVGATSYSVYRGTTVGGEAATPIATGLTITTYTDTGLTNGTTYFYKVGAVNTGGASPQSNEASATPQVTTPLAPVGLTATPGSAKVILSWIASSGATSYNVFRGTAAGGEAATPIGTGIATTNYTNTGLTNGTTYFYKVGAVNAGGTSPQSAEASATPAAGTIPGAPSGLIATAGNAQIVLTWTAGAGATSYTIFRATASRGEGRTPLVAGVASTTYTDTGLINGTAYYYVVTAVNSTGSSGQSTEAHATPSGASLPSTPASLTATAGNTTVSLSWTAGAGATSYNVYRGTTAGAEAATPIATSDTATTYIDTGLANGTTYYYKVSAVNASGTSTQSNEASATPQVSAPPAPTGLTATSGVAQIVLSWTASSGATSYNVYRGTTAGGEAATPIGTGVSTTNYTNTGLTNGTTYFYKVGAVNAGGTSPQSAEASATPAAGTIPGAPSGLIATAGNAQIVLTWTAGAGATSYSIFRATASRGEGRTPLVAGVASTTYTDAGLVNGTAYYYVVTAVNSMGSSSQSAEAHATPSTTPLVVPSTLTVNPNPAFSSGEAVATLTLTGAAPTGGAAVAITFNGSADGTVTVPAGQASATFTLAFSTVTVVSTYTLGAAYNGVTVSTPGTLDPTSVGIASFTYTPSTIVEGANSVGTVTLTAPAPAGGAFISISGSVTYAFVVLAGQTSASYIQPTTVVGTTTTYPFTAAYNGTTASATLTATR